MDHRRVGGVILPKYSEVLDEWLAKHRLKIADPTAYNYAKAIQKIKNRFGDIEVSDITDVMIYDYVQYLKNDSGLVYTSTRLYCKIVRQSLRYALIQGYIRYNPADDVKMPGRCRAEIQVYTQDEIVLLSSAEGLDWVRDGIIIASRTGMRPSEVYALKWTDISFEYSYISVQRAISRACSSTKVTKTPAGTRRIDIDSKLVAHLRGMYDRADHDNKFVFPAPPLGKHEYRVPWNLAPELRKMCQSVGIPYRNFYCFRHSHATILLEMGVHPKIVQERLGHSSIKITLDTYSHVTPTIQQRAVYAMEQLPI